MADANPAPITPAHELECPKCYRTTYWCAYVGRCNR